MTIADMLTNLTKFDLAKAGQEVLLDNEVEILDLNREQLMEGIDKEGVKLRPYYFSWYADFKDRINSRGVTDLKVTGAFHNGFAIRLSGPNGYYIYSRDPKEDMLVEGWTGRNGVSVPGYGPKIYGLTNESAREAKDKFFYKGMKEKLTQNGIG